MQSNQSISTASRRWASFDPSTILLPLFIGLLRAAPFPAFFEMFLQRGFGISHGLAAPNAWALALICAIAFWAVRYLPRHIPDNRLLNIAFVFLGIALWIGWMALEPEWDVLPVLKNPILLVNGAGQFGWVFVVTFVFWLLSLRLAMDERELSAEGVRGIFFRSVAAILAGVFIASLIGGEMGEAGLSASYVALPVALVSGIGAVGMSEMVATRKAARQRGVTVPGWDRWGRTFAGAAIAILLITFLAALVFGPGFLQAVIDTIATLWRGIATVLLWVIYGLVYAFFWIWTGIAWLINHFFGTTLAPPEMPQMGEQGAPPEQTMAEYEQPGPWKYASLLRFGALASVVVLGLLVLSRFVRFRGAAETDLLEEERSSVFSGSLLRNQLRNLFARGEHTEKPRTLNLTDDPQSVREAMLYLQVLAERRGKPRGVAETASDFTGRLASVWPQVAPDLAELNQRYERVRYGETEEDRAAAIAAWRVIRDMQLSQTAS